MTEAIPYPDIIEQADRRWTFRLLARLDSPDLDDDERDQLIRALEELSDRRSFEPLKTMLCDVGRPERVRSAAGIVLRNMNHAWLEPPDEQIRQWWESDDPLLRRHALRNMDGYCLPHIVLQVASDLTHPLHLVALYQMEYFSFPMPAHQAIRIKGLSHPDAEVREQAAYTLLWDEPVIAEGPLLAATHDPVAKVVQAAATTLQYYPTMQVYRRLHELRDHADEEVREQVAMSLQTVSEEFRYRLYPNREDAAHFRRWLAPIWELLAFTDEDLNPEEDDPTTPGPAPEKLFVPLMELLALFADPDSSPKQIYEVFGLNDWTRYDEAERRQIRDVFLTHPDQQIRREGVTVFADWHDTDGLLIGLRDADFSVRKRCTERLAKGEPSPTIAALMRERLQGPDAVASHHAEILDALVHHSDRTSAIRLLATIAGDHGQLEGSRVKAIWDLERLEAVDELALLAGQLLEPPAVTWQLHVSLFDALRKFHLAIPDLRHLRDVDHCAVQEIAAQLPR